MLRNLKDAVLSAESVFGDMFRNIITVAERFRSLHEVFDAAIEEDCVFSCPEGKITRFAMNFLSFQLRHTLFNLILLFLGAGSKHLWSVAKFSIIVKNF